MWVWEKKGGRGESLKGQYLSWDQLSCAGCSLSFSDQNSQGGICCLLFALLLVGRTHRWEPAAAQLGLVGEPAKATKVGGGGKKQSLQGSDRGEYGRQLLQSSTNN